MVIEMKINNIRLVAPDMNEVYEISYIIVEGMDKLMDDSNIELRRSLINTYGDGEKMYILVPEKASATHLYVESIGTPPVFKSNRRSTTKSSSDVKILYRKDV